MQTTFSFQKTPVQYKRQTPPMSQLEQQWDSAIDQYNQGQYRQAVISTIEYCTPYASEKMQTSGDASIYHIPHGSVVVSVKLDNEKISICCPFLALPGQGEIALMRKVTEINSDVLGLPSIVLNENQLEFRYESPIELCHPNKLYDVLWDICVNADYYDDQFVNEFKAVRLKEPVVTPYDPTLVKQSYEFFKQAITECNEYISYFESKRLNAFAWDAVSMCLRKMDYFLKPQGYVGNMIRDAVAKMNNRNIPFMERISEGKKAIGRLQEITEEKLADDLYYTEEFVSWKRYGKLEYIQQYFQDNYETATTEIKKGEYMACTCTIQIMYMNMFYYYRLTPEIQQFAEYNMMQSSGKTWKEAAEMLYESLDNFMEGNLLTAMSNENFDSNAFASSMNFDMNAYMQQAMEASKNMMAQLSNLLSGNK